MELVYDNHSLVFQKLLLQLLERVPPVFCSREGVEPQAMHSLQRYLDLHVRRQSRDEIAPIRP